MDSRSKWNSKYHDRLETEVNLAPNKRLESLSQYFRGGKALDFASGLGANSYFLATNGYHVQALDISDTAVQFIENYSKEHNLTITPLRKDLTESLNLDSFDLVVVCYYLDREMFCQLKNAVKQNGYFFMETFFQSPNSEKETISAKFKLFSGELLTIFHEWQILYFEENEAEGRQTIFVRKP